ncbi:hypothetical protein L2E82_49997 [Cichorium intybus]|nr:hypothetical protein L2E82_49997 [Cichorium intybus]
MRMLLVRLNLLLIASLSYFSMLSDLDMVDNGCINHLIQTFYDDDWDVLIAHVLGVVDFDDDHAGHIFGIDSTQMIEKLEQYNEQLETDGALFGLIVGGYYIGGFGLGDNVDERSTLLHAITV